MDTDLKVKIHKQGDIPVLDLSGDIDAFTCGKLREAIIGLINAGDRKMVISMDNVRYIDSSGLGTLVGGLRRVSEHDGGLALSGASPQVRKVFNITGLSKVFAIFDDETEAASSLSN